MDVNSNILANYMPPIYLSSMSKRLSYKGHRYPAIVMYQEDVEARRINEEYWKKRMGHKYAYAEVMRLLQRGEAKNIQAHGKSLLTEE